MLSKLKKKAESLKPLQDDIQRKYDVFQRKYTEYHPHIMLTRDIFQVWNSLPKNKKATNYLEASLTAKLIYDRFSESLVQNSNAINNKLKDLNAINSWITKLVHNQFNKLDMETVAILKKDGNGTKQELQHLRFKTKNVSVYVYKEDSKVVKVLTENISDVTVVLDLCREHFWARFDSNRLMFDDKLNSVVEEKDEEVFDTQATKALLTELQSYKDSNINRSILFYGPPGSGKSNLIKSLCKSLGFRTFRIALSATNNYNLAAAVKFMRPNILILEDIDHVKMEDLDKILSVVESVHNEVDFILASANVISKLDPAFQRPGRFDELIEIKRLDPDLHFKLVGQDQDLYKFTAEFPASYIIEFMKRVKIKGKDAALKNSQDILDRVQNLDKFNYKVN